VAEQIEAILRRWKRQGKRTRRNWWSVLAGNKDGKPRRVAGTLFPVIALARRRASGGLSKNASGRGAMPIAHGRTVVVPLKKGPPVALAKHAGVGTEPAAASQPRDPAPKPFVKWAGGKRQLLSAILGEIPEKYGTYHEPFLGGGAVFFALSPRKAFLSDSNRRLVRCYTGIKEHVDDVISLLNGYKRNRRFFQEMRRRDIDDATDAEVAAWFIYLNKTGFNGLYRVNSKNQFNVPFGDNKNGLICDEENLKACSRALADAEINCEDFEKVADRAQPNDLVYFDPPYVPLSATSYFTSYTARGFTRDDQVRLRNLALRLKEKGVHVLLSNSSSAAELYSKDFSVIEVLAARPVNSKAERRGKITELLIR
jgi:DNA adenine methylase